MKIFYRKEKLKFLFLILCFFSFVVFTEFSEVHAGSLDTDVVIFPDKNLEVSIREKLAKPTGDITVGDMKGISGYLSLSDKRITNIVGLEHLSSVSGLVLSNNNITDLSPIANLTNLTDLALNYNPITNIDVIKNLTGLTSLSIVEIGATDLSSLATLENLQYLEIQRNKLTSIEFVRNMKQMVMIDADGNNIQDFSPLVSLPLLTGLRAANNNITNFTDISKLTNLDFLNLSDNSISDIGFLSSLLSLENLFLADNQIRDISPLKDLVNVRTLNLSNNQISDISNLQDLVNISSLNLSNNQISDISPLQKLVDIRSLYLSNNPISDITALTDKTKLNRLYMRNTKLKEIPEFISSFKMLTTLDLSNNNLNGIIPISFNDLRNLQNWDPPQEEDTSFENNNLIGVIPENLKSRLNSNVFNGNFFEGEPNQKQLVLNDGVSLNLSLNSIPTQNTLRSLVHVSYKGTDSNASSLDLELVPVETNFFDSTGKAVKSGSTSAYIRIKGAGDTNAYARTVATVPIAISDKIGSNNDITVDFSIDNSLEAVLGSNTINFGEVSSVGGEIQNTTLTVSSSLVYNISTMAYGDFVGSIDGANIIPIDKISLDIDGLGYKALSKNKTINVGDSPSAINKVHNLNFKMGDTLGYKKDNYNAVVQFIVDVK